ncbi:glycosyltransferase family 1 protein [Candidatus Ventrimonas sp. KK005]
MASNKIHILQVLTLNCNSGVASFVINLYQHIDKEKIQFDFLTWVVDENLPVYNDIIIKSGGVVHTIPYYKKDLKAFINRTSNILNRNKIDILHCHEFLVSIPILYLGKRAGIPVRIAHSHNPTIDNIFKQKLVILCRPLFRKYATSFFACSQDSGTFLFGKKVKFLVLKNGINTLKFQYSSEIRKKLKEKWNLENRFVIGNIGRMTSQKNQTFLLSVFAEIVKERPDALLLLIGKGELESSLYQQVRSLKIQDYVLFLGIRDDIYELMNIMDVFVLPSVYEGLGIVLIEAQANGLPCVISDTIPKEVKINSNCHFLSLNANFSIWKRAILNTTRENSEVAVQNVNSAEYNIVQSTIKLQKFYLYMAKNRQLRISERG